MRTLSERVYAILLLVYPKRFRREYGPLMAQAFGDQCREESGRGGAFGLVRLWLRTLPDLMVSMVSERSRAMGNALVRTVGFMTLKNLMLFNAAVLLAFGIVFANGPWIELYGFASPTTDSPNSDLWTAYALARFLGVVCVGFGALLFATSRAVELLVPQTVAGSLFVAYVFGSVVLLVQQTNAWATTAGWITVAVHAFFAVGYGFLWLKGSLAGVPLDAKPSYPTREAS